MVNDELVDLIAESIYMHIYDLPHPSDLAFVVSKKKPYIKLTEIEKSFFLNVAHDIMCVYDDFYDAELEDDDIDYEEDDEAYEPEDVAMEEDEEPDDGYGEHQYWEG